MARTALAVQSASLSGLTPSFTAANVDGHSMANDGQTMIYVKNGHTGAQSVTAVTPQKVGGLAVEDVTVSIPAGGERIIGGFEPLHFGRTVDLNFSGVTALTIAAIRV